MLKYHENQLGCSVPVMLRDALFIASLIGLAGSTAFLLLVSAAALRYWHFSHHYPVPAAQPKVSLLKPLCGLEPNLEANLASFFSQDYPNYEIIFGARHSDDPALRLARDLQKRHPNSNAKLVLSGEPTWPNAKVFSLEKMCAAATSDYFVISDSDVRVQPNYLREIMSAIVQPGVGMVTCLYRGVPTGGLWARLEALGMSVEMTSGVLVADMLEGMRFALGPTMAIRREVLDAVGGMAGLAEYCADDYLLGQRAFAAGWQVVLSHHVIDHVVVSRDFRSSVLHQVRWMKSTRFSRGLAHIGTGLTFAMPYGLLGCAAGLWMKRPALAGVMLGIAVLNRFLLALVSGWNVVRDRRVLRDFWLYPLRDLMGFAFWCASFFGNTIHWRGERYTLHRGGRMRRIAVPDSSAPESKPVAVDRLA